jgi:hypothetical protein
VKDRCTVCKSPHVASIDAFLLQRDPRLTREEISAKFNGNPSEHSLKRHWLGKHVTARMNAIEAYTPADGVAISGDLTETKRQLAATLTNLQARMERVVTACEKQYERFKDSPNASDVATLLRLNLQALREVGDLAGLYKKDGPTIDNRSIHLSGLSQEQLTTLIDGLRGSLV